MNTPGKPPSRDKNETFVPLVPRPPSLASTTAAQSLPNPKTRWLGVIFIVLGLGLGYFLMQEEESDVERGQPRRVVSSTDVTDQKVRQRLEGMVNQHIQLTNRRIEIEKEQIKVESFKVPRVGDFVVDTPPTSQSFNHRGDQSEMNAVRDLQRNDQEVSMSANAIIQSEMANQQVSVEIDQAYRDEYVRQFKENARRNGYEVQLSPDFRVIGVRRIRQGASQEGFGGGFR